MKTSKSVWAFVLGLIALVAPSAVRADTIVQVTISNLTFNGANACGPSGTAVCTQTLSESWLWDNTTQTYVTGSFSSTTAGVLGTSFALPGAAPSNVIPFPVVTGFSGATWVASDIRNSNGDDLIVYLGLGGTLGPLITGTYTLSNSGTIFVPLGMFDVNLSCASTDAACNAAYPGPLGGGSFAAFSTGGTVTVTNVPEPSTAALLGAGIFGLVGIGLFRKARG